MLRKVWALLDVQWAQQSAGFYTLHEVMTLELQLLPDFHNDECLEVWALVPFGSCKA